MFCQFRNSSLICHFLVKKLYMFIDHLDFLFLWYGYSSLLPIFLLTCSYYLCVLDKYALLFLGKLSLPVHEHAVSSHFSPHLQPLVQASLMYLLPKSILLVFIWPLQFSLGCIYMVGHLPSFYIGSLFQLFLIIAFNWIILN